MNRRVITREPRAPRHPITWSPESRFNQSARVRFYRWARQYWPEALRYLKGAA